MYRTFRLSVAMNVTIARRREYADKAERLLPD